jgi:hypothetical protein
MGRARKIHDDVEEDDDRLPPRRGRRPAPEVFGPPKPEAHQREAHARRLQSILDTLGPRSRRTDVFATDAVATGPAPSVRSKALCRRLRREPGRFAPTIDRGDSERNRGPEASHHHRAVIMPARRLDRPRLGVFRVDGQGAAARIQTTLRELGLEDRLENAIRWRLTRIMGQPVAAQPKPPKPAREPVKTPPPSVTKAGWEAALAMHKANRLRRAKSRTAARMAA